jgi:hypothetical protein
VFDPELLYQHFYQDVCQISVKAFYHGRNSSFKVERECKLILSKLTDMFTALIQGQCTASALHRIQMKSWNLPWTELFDNKICLCCLQRCNPDYIFSCNHTICEVCVRIFGVQVPGGEYIYKLDDCLFCDNGKMQVTLHGPTRGVRLLSIDGGGSRGRIPLEFLLVMQEIVGPQCKVIDLFDLAVGTSSGN